MGAILHAIYRADADLYTFIYTYENHRHICNSKYTCIYDYIADWLAIIARKQSTPRINIHICICKFNHKIYNEKYKCTYECMADV